MSNVKIFYPENRLSKILNSGNPQKISDLIANAEARICLLSNVIIDDVRKKTENIIKYAAKDDETLRAKSTLLAQTALHVAEVAGAAKLDDIGDIANGIHAMVEAYQAEAIWHGAAVRLHIGALKLMKAQGLQASGGKIVADRLRAMRIALGIIE